MNTKTLKSTTETVAEVAEKAVEAVTEASREAAENVIKTGTETSADAYDKVVAFGYSQVGKASDAYENAASFGKKNLETLSSVANAVTTGMLAYNSHLIGYWKDTTTANIDYYEQLAAAKCPQDVATSQMDAYSKIAGRSVVEAVELNKIAVDSLTKTVAPVKERFEEAFAMATKWGANA